VVFHPGPPAKYLLLYSRYWEFPKGLVATEESEENAAVREVREETGLSIQLVPGFRESIQYFYRRGRGGPLVKKQVVYFLGETEELGFKTSWEHQEARWVTFGEALELIDYKNAREILVKANEIVTRDSK
jgi:8-oxo-dGTP pyrophosphatase MutT (NUDIX family)